MATILRSLSYRYQWLYDIVSRLAAITVGGEERLRNLPLQGLTIEPQTKVLDLCCGAGTVTQILARFSQDVTGLDASHEALARAAKIVPEANYVEGLAQNMPLADNQFDLVHTSVALHEMTTQELLAILKEVYRILKPGGIFTLADLHRPHNPVFWPPLAIFMWLFETETAWQLLQTDLVTQLESVGFRECQQFLYAGGSFQVIQAQK